MSPDTNSQPDQRSKIKDHNPGITADKGLPITDHRSETVKTVLAIASAGGHWVQLRRLHPAFEGTRLVYSTTKKSYGINLDGAEFRLAPDGNLSTKFRLIRCAFEMLWMIISLRPDVVISTGAAPGYFGIVFARMLGKKTIWVDSIANAEELSLSGKKVGKYVDHWITQWKHLARPNGPHFYGNVLGDEVGATVRSGEPVEPPSGPNQPSDAVGNQPSAISHQSSEHSERKLRIFVTVGTDLPFDRLVRALDDWAPTHPKFEIFAQIGTAGEIPKNISYARHIDPPEYKKRFDDADIVISHAGMGTILTALIGGKQLIVVPRIAALGEHRNEHQLATAKHLQELNLLNVAHDEKELLRILGSLDSPSRKSQTNGQPSIIGPNASADLTAKLNHLIHSLT